MKIFGIELKLPSFGPRQKEAKKLPTYSVDALPGTLEASGYTNNFPGPVLADWTGEKFFGGFGSIKYYIPDYWSLRNASAQLFRENLYARGLIRRLITNEINTGLCLESIPDESTLGLPEDSLSEWAEDIERRFELWSENELVCDYKQASRFSKLQKTARREALIEGDILVVLRQDAATGMPAVQLISGSKVQTPLGNSRAKGKQIVHGVEKDKSGRHVAYWIKNDDGEYNRLEAWGKKSGRRIAWLYYGTDKRMDETRGEPILSLMLQSLKEVDRYRDSVQRRAVIQSIISLWIEKTKPKAASLPVTGGAVRKDAGTVTDGDGSTRNLKLAANIPGLVVEELEEGEKIHGFGNSTADMNYGDFESAIIHALAWAQEIPPEILELAFSNNYSASQAAINEFKIYLNRVRAEFGSEFCAPIYVEWFISEALLRKITANGFLEAWRNPRLYELFGAWIASEWAGAIKPSTDIVKNAKGYHMLIADAMITRSRAARETTGTKFSRNAKRLQRENEELVAAMRPLAEFKREFPGSAEMIDDTMSATDDELVDTVADVAAEIVIESQTGQN